MESATRKPRPFLGVMYTRCQAYGRLYRDATGQHYVGFCPRCGQAYRVRIGPGGTSQRFFRAQCPG